jgi:hypothetical protein
MKLRRPFERLMELVEAVHDTEPPSITMEELSQRWDEPVDRIMDAIDAFRVKNGERTYITLPPEEKP